jgi:hypothetical protein
LWFFNIWNFLCYSFLRRVGRVNIIVLSTCRAAIRTVIIILKTLCHILFSNLFCIYNLIIFIFFFFLYLYIEPLPTTYPPTYPPTTDFIPTTYPTPAYHYNDPIVSNHPRRGGPPPRRQPPMRRQQAPRRNTRPRPRPRPRPLG